MRRGSQFPAFFDWTNDPTAPARQNQSIGAELEALWNTLDERATLVVVPNPGVPRGEFEHQAQLGEHVLVSMSGDFTVRLPGTTNQDEGRFVDVSRTRVGGTVIVLAGPNETQQFSAVATQATINGALAFLLQSSLSPRRFRVVGGSWRT